MISQPRSTSQSSSRSNPNFSSSSYASSFPILNPSSALHTNAIAHEGRKTVIRTGHANVKEEGIRSFLWSKRWLVLGGTDLQIFKNEVSLPQLDLLCALADLYPFPCRHTLPDTTFCAPSGLGSTTLPQVAILLAVLYMQLDRSYRRTTCRPQTVLCRIRDKGQIDIFCIQDGRRGLRLDGRHLLAQSTDGRLSAHQLRPSGSCGLRPDLWWLYCRHLDTLYFESLAEQ